MSLIARTISVAERIPLPDLVIRSGVRTLVGRTANRLAQGDAASDAAFARAMAQHAIAEETDAANSQHYEVPAAFFELVLGPNRKYSSCFYRHEATTLREAEEEALRQTASTPAWPTGRISWNSAAAGARCRCGWRGSFPNARITAVSNSQSQRAVHRGTGRRAGPAQSPRDHRRHERVRAGPSAFRPCRFGRDVRAHDELARAAVARTAWLKPDGRLFLHIFTHRDRRLLFDRADKEDWIAQHFFTGGVMPSHG